MAWYEGTVTENSGTNPTVPFEFIKVIKEKCEANGWQTLIYDTSNDNGGEHNDTVDLMLKGQGLSGEEEIFIGFRALISKEPNVRNSFFANLYIFGFTGYISSVPFLSQPGANSVGICLSLRMLDYYMAVNAQRITFVANVNNGVTYESAYAGKMKPYVDNTVYPYPLCIVGTINGYNETRSRLKYTTKQQNGTDYSDCGYLSNQFTGNNRRYRKIIDHSNTWVHNLATNCTWVSWSMTSWRFYHRQLQEGNTYLFTPINILSPSYYVGQTGFRGIYGELDGVYATSGDNNAALSRTDSEGRNFICFNGLSEIDHEFFALEIK